jgi:pyridoxal phosphate enzyme (YggS family)
MSIRIILKLARRSHGAYYDDTAYNYPVKVWLTMTSLASRLALVQDQLAQAAQRANRSIDEICLVGVSKTHPAELVREALDAGLRHFGENRVQEAEGKVAALADVRENIHWHLIGQLQRNKAKKAASFANMIHSIDSLRLAEFLNRVTGELQTEGKTAAYPLPILLEVNVSGEESKSGFALAQWQENPAQRDQFLAEVEQVVAMPHLRLAGLMTVAPWGDDPEEARPTFRSTRLLRDLLAQKFPQADLSTLSMGMSDDFAVAIEEGSTMVRIGRAIFGARPPISPQAS